MTAAPVLVMKSWTRTVGELLASAEHDRRSTHTAGAGASWLPLMKQRLPAGQRRTGRFCWRLLASAEHDRQIDASPVLAQELAPADEAAPTGRTGRFVGGAAGGAEHDRQIDAPPAAQELAPLMSACSAGQWRTGRC